MARVKLLKNSEAPPKSKEFFQKVEGNGATVLNLYRAVANSPATISNFVKLGSVLLNQADLSPKHRELAILRVAILSGSEYELAQHTSIALEAGITQEQLDELHLWEESSCFSKEEKSILRYTDEVTINVKVSDETFSELGEYLNEQSIVELTMSIGYWGMIARVLVPLEVDMEEAAIGSSRDLLGKQKDEA